MRSAAAVISFLHKLEQLGRESSELPVDTIRLFNKKKELIGICFLSGSDAGLLEQALASIVTPQGGMVSLSAGGVRPCPAQADSAQPGFPKLAGQKDVSGLLQLEMEATRLKRVPCALIILRLTGKKSKRFGQAKLVVSKLCSALVAESSLFNNQGMAVLAGETAASFASDFYFVLPDTGLNKAKREIDTVRGTMRRLVQTADFPLIDCTISAALGIFQAGDRITAAELIDKVALELKKSAKKDGALGIVTRAARDSCQVSVEERAQLFGFIKRN